MNVLITGGSGVLGKPLLEVFPAAFAPSHKEMDITDAIAVEKVVFEYKPSMLIHTAAFVDVRGCEQDKKKAWQTNVEGTINIVNALSKLGNGCYLAYISTACVFEGENKKFYTEDDIPSPKNYYSFTKVCGEISSRQYKNSLVVRTNFAPREKWKYPRAFTDRFGTYLFSDDVAKGILEVLDKRIIGIVHIVGDRRMSMHDLARITTPDVEEITLKEYNGPIVTVDMSLSTNRWKKYKISK